MEVEYTLSVEDHVAFMRFHRANPAGGRAAVWQSRIVMIILIVAAVGFPIMLNLDRPAAMLGSAAAIVAGMAVLLVMVFLFRPWLEAALLRSHYKQNPVFQKRLRLQINARELAFSNDAVAAQYSWTGIERIPMTDDHAFFYISKMQAVILPRHAFADAAAFQEFVEAARQYQEEARAAAGRFKQPGAADSAAPKAAEAPAGEFRQKTEGLQGPRDGAEG